MQLRAARIGVVALLVVSTAAAAVLWWQYDTERGELDGRARALDAVVERALPAAGDIAAAQRAYVDYGLRDEATFARLATLIQQLTTDSTRLRLGTIPAASRMEIDRALAALATLATAAAQAQTHLQASDPLAAAEALLGAEAQRQVGELTKALRAFQTSELRWLGERRSSIATRVQAAIASTALIWAIVLVMLSRAAPGPPQVLDQQAATVPPSSTDAAVSATDTSRIDLAATADVCSAIARLADADGLPSVLDRAAALLDARGIVLWMGAGDELFPAAGSGYDRAIMQRLRPIPRGADNATAAAWRTGAMRIVPGDATGPGAIVAPMCAPGSCLGVLAAEVRNGREADEHTQAVATILAAQLSGVLTAWPAASTGAAAAARDGGERRGSERNSAAL